MRLYRTPVGVISGLLGAEGAYRTPSDYGFTFMVLHDVRTV